MESNQIQQFGQNSYVKGKGSETVKPYQNESVSKKPIWCKFHTIWINKKLLQTENLKQSSWEPEN